MSLVRHALLTLNPTTQDLGQESWKSELWNLEWGKTTGGLSRSDMLMSRVFYKENVYLTEIHPDLNIASTGSRHKSIRIEPSSASGRFTAESLQCTNVPLGLFGFPNAVSLLCFDWGRLEIGLDECELNMLFTKLGWSTISFTSTYLSLAFRSGRDWLHCPDVLSAGDGHTCCLALKTNCCLKQMLILCFFNVFSGTNTELLLYISSIFYDPSFFRF